MKIVMILVTGLFVLFMVGYIEQINEMENIIYEMYSSNFYDYLNVDVGLELNVDETKVIEYLKKQGYEANVHENNDGIHLLIKKNYILKITREYVFYKVKNNEYQ